MGFHDLVRTSALLQQDKLCEPSAWLGHIPFGAWLVDITKPQILVELGAHFGHSYFTFCSSILNNNLSSHCYAVDTWHGDVHAGQYADEIYCSVKQHNDSYYSAFSRLLRMTFDEASLKFSDGSVDFLHIDGLHTYEAVQHDFETWLPKLSDSAVVLLHDTNVRERDFGVWRLWEELSCKYPNIHFDHSHGLGVLFVGKEQPLAVQELLKEWSDPEGQATIKQFFARLGRIVELEWQVDSLNLNPMESIAQVIDKLNQALSERDRQLDVHIDKLNQVKVELETNNKSLSWRITKPLRFVERQVNKILRIFNI